MNWSDCAHAPIERAEEQIWKPCQQEIMMMTSWEWDHFEDTPTCQASWTWKIQHTSRKVVITLCPGVRFNTSCSVVMQLRPFCWCATCYPINPHAHQHQNHHNETYDTYRITNHNQAAPSHQFLCGSDPSHVPVPFNCSCL